MTRLNARVTWRERGDYELSSVRYQGNPAKGTLVWTHAYPLAWVRADGVKVIQHLSATREWAIADTRVHAHAGWFRSVFDAMDAADILLEDQR